ncbi:MAG TPA: HU family DNA-binding protein [Bryobacteraceae bacterium]|nr:HU family DNA-binding protein [Bryobacteraceae bacterium]
MTKSQLVEQVSALTQRTKKDTEEMVDAVMSAIIDSLSRGEKVDLRGFGSFQVSEKAERQGRNPRTGETMTIAARKAAVFKPSKEIADRLNGLGSVPVAEPSDGSTKVHGDKIGV